MIDINKEAEEYVKEWCLINSYNERDMIHSHSLPNYETTISLLTKGFIAGHNSKATQAKIIQAQIDILYEFRDYVENSSIFNDRIFKLQEQLKQLENANKI
jgi:hypothetical protein